MIDIVGWDIGGAHLKAVALDSQARIAGVSQRPCPLWLGLDRLDAAVDEIGREWRLAETPVHAITMTGELADHFPDRASGVRAVLDRMTTRLARPLRVFAGSAELLDSTDVTDAHLPSIASANWMASALWLAPHCRDGFLVDIGSTTTDIIPLSHGAVLNRGYTDHERLRYDELVYLGIVRTPLMAMASKAPFRGGWIGLMNEHFATASDLFRLSGELPERADQWPAADDGPKDIIGSARRLARMIGCDLEMAPLAEWQRLSDFFRGALIDRLAASIAGQPLAQHDDQSLPLIGAGTGRFLVPAIAQRLHRPHRRLCEMIPAAAAGLAFSVADCLPAAAVAFLAARRR